MADEIDPETGGPVFRLPPRGLGMADVKRPGYPWIDDPEHPLYAAQQNLWEGWTPQAAMAEAVRIDREKGAHRVNSASHPAYDPGYIVNDHAAPPDAPAPGPAPATRGGSRR